MLSYATTARNDMSGWTFFQAPKSKNAENVKGRKKESTGKRHAALPEPANQRSARKRETSMPVLIVNASTVVFAKLSS